MLQAWAKRRGISWLDKRSAGDISMWALLSAVSHSSIWHKGLCNGLRLRVPMHFEGAHEVCTMMDLDAYVSFNWLAVTLAFGCS